MWLTVVTGHLKVGDDPEKIVHLIGPLLSLYDAVGSWVCGVDIGHIKQINSWKIRYGNKQ